MLLHDLYFGKYEGSLRKGTGFFIVKFHLIVWRLRNIS
ncbi:hypothetical protein CLV36_10661 [Laceyella sediminis]|uniref:Uncharacterized protein n=1 Tax=Laceyella sediminis TaxID=573074 RepID=A0ABX5ENQ2_9BACL|nr:hypothetical protein CLV36_10661 [Laceyella sediminis]